MCFYGDYKVKLLDSMGKWNGLISKGYWPQIEIKDDKLILPKNEEWPIDADKEICVLHWAGGNSPEKMKFKLRFKDEVVRRLEELVKP
jgi:hypothetical protein